MLDITKIIDALHSERALDVDALDVRIVPVRPVPDEAEVSIGRVSIFRQGSAVRTMTETSMTSAARERAQVRVPAARERCGLDPAPLGGAGRAHVHDPAGLPGHAAVALGARPCCWRTIRRRRWPPAGR